MITEQRATVVGVFHDREAARDAINGLKEAGFDAHDISVLSPDKQDTTEIAEDTGTHAGSGAATGALAGGVLGGLGGWLVGIGALAIPGVGPFIAAGAFAAALGGAALGAGVGAIAGALVGMGVPEEEAEYYEGEVKSGRTLVTVRSETRYPEARELMRTFGAYDVETGDRATALQATVSSMPDSAIDRSVQTVELRAEELEARKTAVETGQVTLGKTVVEEQKTLDVPVTREEVYIERHAVNRPSDQPIDGDSERTIAIPVREEQIELEKRPVVYEEVQVARTQVQNTRHLSDTVRHEVARLESEGDVATTGSPGVDDREAEYARALRDDPRYQGRTWPDIESDAEHDWTVRNPDSSWAQARESVRRSWEDATD